MQPAFSPTPPVLSLSERFARIPDPRLAQGRRHPLPAILNLVAVAMLSGFRSLDAIVQFGRERGEAFARALGFTRPKTPAKSTLSLVLRAIDVVRLEAEIGGWMADRSGADAQLAIDGKTLRGSADGELTGAHLLAAFAVDSGAVLAQWRVDAKTNEHKSALAKLGVLPIEGKLITADAMFTHRDFAQKICDLGGDYLLIAKDNQTTLKRDVAALIEHSSSAALSPSAAPTPA